MTNAPRFKEIVRVAVEENLDLVISERGDGLFSCAQQRWTTVHGRRMGQWVKNALITDRAGMEEVANAFMAAIDHLSNRERMREEREAS